MSGGLGALAASGQQLHHPEWTSLLCDRVLDVLDAIYGVDGYVLCGGGGELVLRYVGNSYLGFDRSFRAHDSEA